MPDGDDLRGYSMMPNYQTSASAHVDPALDAEDYDGVQKEVFRTSLIAEWAIERRY